MSTQAQPLSVSPQILSDVTTDAQSENHAAVQPDGQKVIERLIAEIGVHRYEMWFNTARLVASHGRVDVTTDSQFVARWIETHFIKELNSAAHAVLGESATVNIHVLGELPDTSAASGAPAPYQFPGTASAGNSKAPHAGNAHASAARPMRRGSSLRRLEDFVVGASNRLAYSAACTLSEEHTASVISPLFIHGECGVGKTHLLQGICRRAAELHGAAHVRYVTGEQFTNEYIAAVRNQSIDTFRNRVRKLDVLAIDDVQFLSNKARTQSEFQYTLDAIEHLGARIVLASNEHPRQIKKFSPALISRLMQGMVVQVDPPDRETRLKLIEHIATARKLSIMQPAAELIATHCIGSVRELEGAITKLAALRKLSHAGGGRDNSEVGLLLVEQLLKDAALRPATPVRIGGIIDSVCSRVGITRGDLMSSGRHRRVVTARALVAYLGREMTTLSYPEIAEAMGRRHHSTVHTAAQRLSRQMAAGDCITLTATDAPIALCDLVDQLRQEITRR